MLIIDTHADTLEKALRQNVDISSNKLHFNTLEVPKNHKYIQCLAMYLKAELDNSKELPFKACKEMIDKYYSQMSKYSKIVDITSKEKLENFVLRNIDSNLGTILTIENVSTALGEDFSNLEYMYEKGVRMMSLVWNFDNVLACGAKTKNDTGLTKYGKKSVKKIQDTGIILDVSHLSHKSFWDLLKVSTKPVVVSHSCVNSICQNPRNLTDIQIKEIARQNGMVSICYYTPFLTNKEISTSEDIVNNIDYVVSLVGIDYVGLGSDFDGVSTIDLPQDVRGVKDVVNILECLKKRGYKNQDIEKIAGKNYFEFFRKSLK